MTLKINEVAVNLSSIFFQGLVTCIGLIMVIGSQNAFILRQGVQRKYVFLIATVSLLGDIVLIGLGVNGLGAFVQSHPFLELMMVIGGSLFLTTYGCFAFYSAWKKEALDMNGENIPVPHSRHKTIMLALTFSLLNPHAWLDAAVILGSIGGQLDNAIERYIFTAGALLGSTIWFYSLAFFAWKLAPYLRSHQVWRWINISVGVLMWGIAFSIIKHYLDNV